RAGPNRAAVRQTRVARSSRPQPQTNLAAGGDRDSAAVRNAPQVRHRAQPRTGPIAIPAILNSPIPALTCGGRTFRSGTKTGGLAAAGDAARLAAAGPSLAATRAAAGRVTSPDLVSVTTGATYCTDS